MNLNKFIEHNIETKFNNFVLKTIELYGIYDVSANIHRSQYINLKIIKLIYEKIKLTKSKNTNIMLNNLFNKCVIYNFGNQISENDIEKYIKNIDVSRYENHICSYNYHNYMESTCEYSIFRSFENCLYFYINDINIIHNKNISDSFANKYLSSHYYNKFKNSDKILYNENIVKTTEDIDILWDNIGNNISVQELFDSKFHKQIKEIKNECIYYWQAKCKIENWLFRCYWDPKSSYRKKKLEQEIQEFNRELQELFC